MHVILASASPRRAALLRAAGIEFSVYPAEVDESLRSGEDADAYVTRIALAKAERVAAAVQARPVLAADTAVVVDGRILGKPSDERDAVRMVRLLSGRVHEVLTGLALVGRAGGDRGEGPGSSAASTAIARTTVEVTSLSDSEIAEYVASGESLDKAGAYAIQGLASRFVTRIEGSYSNVVGLPVALVYQMLRRG